MLITFQTTARHTHHSWRSARLAGLGLLWLTACRARDEPSVDRPWTTDRAAARQSSDVTLDTGWVYTADEGAGTLSRVDLHTGTVTTIPIGVTPHSVQIAPDGQTVLAVGSPGMGGHEQSGARHEEGSSGPPGMLVVLAADASDTSGALRIPVGRAPAHVVTSRDGRRAFTTSSAENAVFVVDLATRRVVDTIPTAAYAHGLRLSPDGRELYVACVTAGVVSVLDAEQLREVARIPVGRAPVQVGFLSDGSRAYVTLGDDNAVAVIDTRTRRVIARIPVGRSPIQLMATPDGSLVYVANQGTEAQPDSTVSVLATARNAVAATVLAGRGAPGVAVSHDGTRAFIANTFAGTLTVIDIATQRPLRTLRVGAGAGGITFRP